MRVSSRWGKVRIGTTTTTTTTITTTITTTSFTSRRAEWVLAPVTNSVAVSLPLLLENTDADTLWFELHYFIIIVFPWLLLCFQCLYKDNGIKDSGITPDTTTALRVRFVIELNELFTANESLGKVCNVACCYPVFIQHTRDWGSWEPQQVYHITGKVIMLRAILVVIILVSISTLYSPLTCFCFYTILQQTIHTLHSEIKCMFFFFVFF